MVLVSKCLGCAPPRQLPDRRDNLLRAVLMDDHALATAFSSDGFTALHFAAFFGKAEAARMRQLGVYLSDDHLCPKGYTITGRRIVGVNGNFALVSYDGVCS